MCLVYYLYHNYISVILSTDGPEDAVEDGGTVKWWNEVSVSEMTSTTTGGPQATSDWNWSSDVATDDNQTLSVGTTMKWNMSITDIITGQLTSQLVYLTTPKSRQLFTIICPIACDRLHVLN